MGVCSLCIYVSACVCVPLCHCMLLCIVTLVGCHAGGSIIYNQQTCPMCESSTATPSPGCLLGQVILAQSITTAFANVVAHNKWWCFRMVREVFDGFRLFNVGLVASERFSPWRQQTRSGFPVRFSVCPTVKPDCIGQRQKASNHRKNHFRFAAAR